MIEMVFQYNEKVICSKRTIIFMNCSTRTLQCFLGKGGNLLSTSTWVSPFLYSLPQWSIEIFSIHFFFLCFCLHLMEASKAFLTVLPFSCNFSTHVFVEMIWQNVTESIFTSLVKSSFMLVKPFMQFLNNIFNILESVMYYKWLDISLLLSLEHTDKLKLDLQFFDLHL